MIHELRSLATKFGFSLYDADSHEVKAFIEYERQLFQSNNPTLLTYLEKTEETGKLYNTVRLADVDVQLPKPFIFSLRPTTANISAAQHGERLHQSFVIYDNAGESFDYLKDRDASKRATQHLAEADAIFFAYDPLQEPNARERLAAISEDPQLHLLAVNYRQEQTLTETINRIRRHRGLSPTETIDTCLCVCVQKYDTWLPLLRDITDAQGQYVRPRFADGEDFPDPVLIDKAHNLAGIDVEQINRVSLIVRDVLEELNPQLVALAESSFKTVRYFPVSALGSSPSPKNDMRQLPMSSEPIILKVRPDQIQPRRVTTPILWLLHRERLIYRTTRPASRDAKKYPHAVVESVDGQILRVRTPTTRRVVLLDLEYAGSVIEEPGSGQLIWIPAVQPPTEPPPPPPPPAAKAGGAPADAGGKPLGLSINKHKRKGWFRR